MTTGEGVIFCPLCRVEVEIERDEPNDNQLAPRATYSIARHGFSVVAIRVAADGMRDYQPFHARCPLSGRTVQRGR